jgi:hypothetical protein
MRQALWWWIDRWRKSTAYTDMTLEEQGAYRNLLDEAALRGGLLPNDERVLAKACGDATRGRRVRTAVYPRIVVGVDGFLHHETLDVVLAESERRATKQARWRARGNWGGNGGGNVGGNVSGNAAVSPPVTGAVLQSPITNHQSQEPQDLSRLSAEASARFERFWQRYPRKVGRSACEHLWARLKPDDGQTADFLAAIDAQRATAQWQDARFIPHPHTWLHQGRWRDEVAAPAATGAPEVDWWAECQVVHGGACGLSQRRHAQRLMLDAEKTREVHP